eukprot:TRINITY_DN862_c0_g1_i1.p1 TRINITY_DN862_c0_g1~~TRINITY_DN862_c0_g1_i1.p1  ORF type:complete len:879 (+),score=257.84 TRINITY_DN862_c0_g1_i1:198-2639(+)
MDTIEKPPPTTATTTTTATQPPTRRKGFFDIEQWQEERAQLTSQRLQLEERLNLREAELLKPKQDSVVTAAPVETSPGYGDMSAEDEALFARMMSKGNGLSKVLKKGGGGKASRHNLYSSPATGGSGSAKKRSQREITNASSLFAEEEGPKSKKPRSVSKRDLNGLFVDSATASTWANSPPSVTGDNVAPFPKEGADEENNNEEEEEEDSSDISSTEERAQEKRDAIKSLTNFSFGDDSSDSDSGSDSGSAFSAGDDLLANLNKMSGGSDSGSDSDSDAFSFGETDLLSKLDNLSASESADGSESDSEAPAAKVDLLASLNALTSPADSVTDGSGSGSDSEEEADFKDSKKDLLSALNDFSFDDGEGDSESESGEESEADGDAKSDLLAALNSFSGGTEQEESEEESDEESEESPRLFAGKDAPSATRTLLATLDAFKPPAKTTDADPVDPSAFSFPLRTGKPKGGRAAKLASKVPGTGRQKSNTFDLFRQLNKKKKGTKSVDSGAKSDDDDNMFDEKSDSWDSSEDLSDFEDFAGPIHSYGVADDINKAGMRRGKKGKNLKFGQKGAKYNMEDTNLVLSPLPGNSSLSLFCVFDGHAGKGCSTALLTTFPEVFAKHWTAPAPPPEKIPSILNTIFNEADEQLKEYEYEGSTGTTIAIWKDSAGHRYLQSANVGDSTGFLVRSGKALALGEDHKPTLQSERDRIKAMGITLEDGQSRLNGLAVSRAFGNHFPKEMNCGMVVDPYVSPLYQLTTRDTQLIIASDGLWDIITGQRAADLVKHIQDPVAAAKKLCNIATASSKCHDNVTVIVVRLR